MRGERCVHCGNPETSERLKYPVGVIGEQSDIRLEFNLCGVCHRVFTLDVGQFNDYSGEAVTPEEVFSTLNSMIEQEIEEATETESKGENYE